MQFFTEAVNVLKNSCNRVRRRPSRFGVLSISWRDTATIIPAQSRRELNSSWLISWNKKRKENAQSKTVISGRLQEINCDFTRLVL